MSPLHCILGGDISADRESALILARKPRSPITGSGRPLPRPNVCTSVCRLTVPGYTVQTIVVQLSGILPDSGKGLPWYQDPLSPFYVYAVPCEICERQHPDCSYYPIPYVEEQDHY